MALLLLLFGGLAVASLVQDSATFDETAYVAAGASQLLKGDYRLNAEHPPLAPMLCMLPAVLLGWADFDEEGQAWRDAVQYRIGYEMLNGSPDAEERRNPMPLLVAARLPVVALGLLLGLVVYGWARELWGRREALTALFLYALSPTILAHTRLLTPDLPSALGFTATLWSFWRFTRKPGWGRAVVLGCSLGAALLFKHSMLTLVPILAILVVVWATDPEGGSGLGGARLARGTGALAVAAVVSAHLIWLAYRYRFAPSPDPSVRLSWDLPVMSGFSGQLLAFARDHRLLPEAYLYGVAWQLVRPPQEVFLNGAVSTSGWWHYYPEAFLLKSTPALLVLCLAVAGYGIVRRRNASSKGLFLLFPALYLFFMTTLKGVCIGHRYLTAVYPLLFILAGLSVRAIAESRWRSWAAAALLLSHAASSLSAFPRYLSYFNVFAGGADHGWKYLVDSNIDWGQDLRRLKSWMVQTGVPWIHLAYFGTGDPRAYGIEYRRIQVLDWLPTEPFQAPGEGEYVAVSVTLHQGLLHQDRETSSFLRLVRGWTPVAKAGDSIFIYRVKE